jgi:hypothetical protein
VVHGAVVNQAELNEHRNYLADERKIQAYREALAEIVRTGDVVLDLGAGTGLLGLLACQAGAGSVIAVEKDEAIIDVARQVAAASGWSDRISHICAFSSEVVLDADVDVAVCDQIGGLVHDAGVLSHFADVRRRLLAPGGTLIPASFRIFLAPVEFETGREAVDFWRTMPVGFDTSAAHQIAANTEWRYNLPADQIGRLSPGVEVGSFASDDTRPLSENCSFEITETGQLDGFIGWFEAQLSPSVTLTNDPWSSDRFRRWWNFYPTVDPIDVRPGDQVDLGLKMSPAHQLVAWTTTIDRGERGVERFTQSTFLSTPATRITSRGRPVPHTERVEQIRSVIDLIDGSRTPKEIADSLRNAVGSTFRTLPQLESLIANVARLIG